jgi:cobalamin synthase
MSVPQQDDLVHQMLRAMRSPAASKTTPLIGACVGALCGGVYWLSAEVWPTSIAIVLSLLCGVLLTHDAVGAAALKRGEFFTQLFYVLVKYNALMALSAANLPFAAPPNLAIPLISVCGYSASRALAVFALVSGPRPAPRMSHVDLGFTLVFGFAPAALLGAPGLLGLVAAILVAMGLYRSGATAALSPLTTEVVFYLGASAAWSFA